MRMDNKLRAEVLIEALPYIRNYSGKILLVKYGGSAMTDENLKMAVMGDLVLLSLIGVKVVLVHGGGPEITDMLGRLGKKTEFVDGLRVTDAETADVVQMVLAGKVNKSLVNFIQNLGGKAIGLSGADGGGEEELDLAVYGAEVLLRPGRDLVPEAGSEAEHYLLFGPLLCLDRTFALPYLPLEGFDALEPLHQLGLTLLRGLRRAHQYIDPLFTTGWASRFPQSTTSRFDTIAALRSSSRTTTSSSPSLSMAIFTIPTAPSTIFCRAAIIAAAC